MEDIDRLILLEKILDETNIETVEKIAGLANDIESLRSAIDDVSEEFSSSFAKLWAALEVISVGHQEGGSELTEREIDDLEEMKRELTKETKREILNRKRP